MKKNTNHNIKLILIVVVIVAIMSVAIVGLTSIFAQTPSPSPTPTATITPSPSPTVQPPISGEPIDPDWTPPIPQLPTIDQSSMTVVANVKPGVVAVNIRVTSYDFFNQPITQQGEGTGWIIDSTGIIVTNNHVVEGAQFISVDLDDGRVFDASAVARDPITDLAVIKIDADNLKALSIGDSSRLAVGQTVIAIGNSLGLGISATQGIVSALGITINPGDQPLHGLIQTDAAINPGNSGGPLLNLAEQVVGINSVKVAEAGVEGMGYAISINDAMPIIQQLIQKGSITRPFVGVNLQTVTPAIATRFDLSVQQGALIVGVADGSPASQGGLQPGDVIVGISNQPVATAADAARLIRSSEIGQQLQIEYWRGNSQATTVVTPVPSPSQ